MTDAERAERRTRISIVCPFYNEEAILGDAVKQLLEKLATLEDEWELIVVNDGSRDGSFAVVEAIAAEHPRLQVHGYAHNRGRGHALRTGIAAARGDIVVTTEIDLSWGLDIVHRLVAAMDEHPEVDIVVASPHLPGGGYKNVPPNRVFLSTWGNKVIRTTMSNAVTMNTGMTRAYRRDVIQTLPLSEERKEFHLEVILKAIAFGLRIHEIPAILEWKEYKHQGERVKRKSSSKIKLLIFSHSYFSLVANPGRYVWLLSAICGVLGIGWSIVAVISYLVDAVAAYSALMGVLLISLSAMFFVFGVVAKQGNMIQRELWNMQRKQMQIERSPNKRRRSTRGSGRKATQVLT